MAYRVPAPEEQPAGAQLRLDQLPSSSRASAPAPPAPIPASLARARGPSDMVETVPLLSPAADPRAVRSSTAARPEQQRRRPAAPPGAPLQCSATNSAFAMLAVFATLLLFAVSRVIKHTHAATASSFGSASLVATTTRPGECVAWYAAAAAPAAAVLPGPAQQRSCGGLGAQTSLARAQERDDGAVHRAPADGGGAGGGAATAAAAAGCSAVPDVGRGRQLPHVCYGAAAGGAAVPRSGPDRAQLSLDGG